MKKVYSLIVIVVLSLIIYTQFTIFVIPPIGLLPEGKTLIIFRLQNGKFIDSPDFYPSGQVIGLLGVDKFKNAVILLRLPYSESLYSFSRKVYYPHRTHYQDL
jgi:hypothetical protein